MVQGPGFARQQIRTGGYAGHLAPLTLGRENVDSQEVEVDFQGWGGGEVAQPQLAVLVVSLVRVQGSELWVRSTANSI